MEPLFTKLKFEDMSNELILCVWDELAAPDVIYGFLHLNTRFNSLLSEFCELYKQLDLCYCSLSACRFFCHQVPTMIEWRMGLTVLKLGHRYRCSQIDMFADEVVKSVITRHFARIGKSCTNAPKNIFRLLMLNSKQIQPIFPQLTTLIIYQSITITEDCRDVLLYVVAGGSSMRTFVWNTFSNETCQSIALFDWLFRCSVNLVNYDLNTEPNANGFELKYERTIVNAYSPHHSLVCLKINILNLNTLYVLLHYLPQLEHLDIVVTSIIDSINITDQNLATKLNYPKKLRIFNIKTLKIRESDCSCLEQLIDKFTNTIEQFSLCLTHYCHGGIDISFNGYHLALLCSKLSQLQSLNFAIQVQFIKRRSIQTLTDYVQAFRTPFWLDGPLGHIQVCVIYHKMFDYVQMYSLPYTFPDNIIFSTIDLIDVRFNYTEEKKEKPNNLSRALRPLWYGMKYLFISIIVKQKIPISFIHTLQCPISQDKVLIIRDGCGILPDNIEDHVQLTQFTTLQLLRSRDPTVTFDLQQLIIWFRLLSKVKCLYVSLTELKSWFTNKHANEYLNIFLRHLKQVYLDCSSIININQNEEVMLPFLSFFIDKQRFPQLQCLLFLKCKHILSSWFNIRKWINFIFTHINEHQLEYLRFEFDEKLDEVTDIMRNNETVIITEPPCVINIYRCVSENRISFWIERKYT